MQLFALIACSVVASAQTTCPDTRPTGYFSASPPTSASYTQGLPAGFVALPTGMTTCQLHELQTYCTTKINQYRANTIKFSDGRSSNQGVKPPLQTLNTPQLKCHNEKALTDNKYSATAGCGHWTAGFNCGLGGTAGTENSCCLRSCSTLATCQSTLDGCLQQMWDEGQIVLDTGAGWNLQTGHFYNMISNTAYLTCGFGWNSNNGVYMTQNFWGSVSGCLYNCANSTSGCGACYTQVSCSEPVPPAGYSVAAGLNIAPLSRTVSCVTGYTGTATKITCQASGLWTSFSGCIPVDCQQPVVSALYSVCAGSSGYLATRQVSCTAGYKGSPQPVTCGATGAWSAPSGCTAATCVAPVQTGYKFSTGTNLALAATRTVTCDTAAGYTGAPVPTTVTCSVCGNAASWLPALAGCNKGNSTATAAPATCALSAPPCSGSPSGSQPLINAASQVGAGFAIALILLAMA